MLVKPFVENLFASRSVYYADNYLGDGKYDYGFSHIRYNVGATSSLELPANISAADAYKRESGGAIGYFQYSDFISHGSWTVGAQAAIQYTSIDNSEHKWSYWTGKASRTHTVYSE